MHFENKEKHMDDSDLDSFSNKRKTTDVQSDIEFKKPYILVQDANIIDLKIIQPSRLKTNKVFFLI